MCQTPRRFSLSAAVVLLSLLGAPQAAADAPPGYFVDSTQAVADRPLDRVEADGDFTMTIHRRYEGPFELRLLGIAEATYPPRDALIDRAIEKGFEMGPDSARTPLWWCDGPGATRVPYAITAGALEHYTRLTDRFRRHNFREASAHGLFWSDLVYKASIEPQGEYTVGDSVVTNVYVVEMNLTWSYDDGAFVPVSVAHRVVVLARDGAVLTVQGDGETNEMVFISSHIGIGRYQRLMR